ncbi:hypothetical protein BJF96_g2888 [Verticillium dahliae]|uniref:Uncharacterized protein n=1 Tax=Verticillium dahliae TaxID=27337 RepID=A0AA45ANT2_VERDA|nr:hypothetical protein BJF96_g2888 [Verticillium dahliae]PNH73756.1 hypothetical protein VD0001_g3759 [Verticillium dahliae]
MEHVRFVSTQPSNQTAAHHWTSSYQLRKKLQGSNHS